MGQKTDIARNPVEKIFELRKPFVYFHTYVIDQAVLDKAIVAQKSLEVDMAMTESGQVFIGHPLSFYEFKALTPPANLEFGQVIGKICQNNLYLVLDCKDGRVISSARQVILERGADKCLFHSWVDGLLFKPYPPEITVEPHWSYEDLPLDKVLRLGQETGVPLIASCRGLTLDRLSADEGTISRHIIEIARGQIVAVNFNLPDSQLPPRSIIDKLLGEKILTWINVDKAEGNQLPEVYLGMSDDLEKASDPKTFA